MAEGIVAHVWLARAAFIALSLGLVFAQLVPLNFEPGGWAPPDLLLAVTLVWVARRPDFVPFYVIFALYLLTDLLFQRPPGLWAGLVLILTEVLRSRAQGIRNMPLMLEWGTVAVGLVVVTLANRFMLAIVMIDQAPLGLTLIQMVMTIAVYPVVALLAQVLFGVTRPAPGAVDTLGHRL